MSNKLSETSIRKTKRRGHKPRVAYLTNQLLDWNTREPRFGGGERYCLTLGTLLRELGFDVTFYQAAHERFEGDYYGFNVISIPISEHFSEFHPGVCNDFYELSASYDHVIYNLPMYASGRMRDDAILLCHSVWFDHNNSAAPIAFRSPEWFTHLYKAFSRPRKIVSVDTNVINVIRALWPELTDRITYLPNWVDTELFHPPEQRDPNQITILFPRRAEFTRGSRLLGPVLEMIPHDCRIRWVGDGEPEDTEIIEAVARRDPRLEFYAASFEQMPRFYQEADICVIPAVASEGTCLAALEGLASGCAVVATNVGGLANLIQPELNGLLVDPQPEQIAAAVNRLIENAEERARYQQAGLRTAANFSLSIWQQRWVGLLTDLEWIAPTARPDLTLSTRSNGAATPAQHNAQVKASYQDQGTDIARLRVDSALYDVICFSTGEWDSGEQVSRRIVYEFANHGHRVFLVSTANTLREDDKPYNLEPLRDKVWAVRLASPNANVVESLEAMRNEFDITRAVSVVQSTVWERPAVIAREHFGWSLIYDCRDGQNSSSGAQSDETLLEGAERLARLADVVLVPSKRMRDKLSPANSNTIVMNKPRIDQMKEAIDRAQLKTNMVDVIKMLAAESLQDETSDSNDNGTLRRLQQIALRLSSSLAEREQAVQAIKGRLAERDRTATALATELQVVEKIVTARDEAIAWLNEELANSRKENVTLAESLSPLVTGYRRLAEVEARLAEVEARAAELVARLADRDSEVQSLSAQLNETQRNNQSLSAQLSDMQRANESLAADLAMQRERADGAERISKSKQTELAQVSEQLAEVKQESASRAIENEKQKRTIDELAQSLSDKVRAVDYRTAQLEEREKIIEARDEAIGWLKTSLAEAHRKGERLQGSNAILSQQLSKKENARQALAGRLAETEAQLGKIVNSIGWQILSRYGRVKYRYLLPVYRALGLMRAEAGTPELAQLPPVEPSSAPQLEEPSASQGADEEPALQRLLAEMAKPSEMAKASDETGNREPAQAFKPDFYESLTLLPHLEQEQVEAILDKEPPAAPSRRLDVICFSIIDWEFRYQRPQQIMSQFAAHGHRVFYVSTTRFLSSDASPRVLVKQIKENVYEVQLASARMPDVYGEVIEGANKQTLLDALEELRSTYQINDAIGYVMIASWGAVALEAKRVWGWRTIYDCMDEWENFPGIKRELLDMELELVRQSDLLVVTGQLLYNKWEKYGRAMVLARNAVDWDFYTEQYRPNTLLTDTKHPVIGYYGAIADWFDVELLSEAARQRPQYTFVVLGGIFDVDVSSLSALPNVHLLGQQPYETMPRYLFHFDVCMIPFKINPITEATDPVKVYEYLSAGKPVVSVNLPELESLREYVYIAKNRDDFVVQLDRAVLEDDSEMVTRRRRFAQENTWENRYLQIEAGLAEVVPRASVIIVTYHNLALNKLCLESLIRNTEYPNYEIIVVDNDSKDGTPAYLRYMAAQYPSISVILNQTNHGFARANNQGIARSNGEYIVLLNNDTVVPPGWLSRLVRHLENDSVGMVGPVTNFVGNEAKIEIDYQTWREMENFAARHIWEHDRKAADIYMLAMFCVAFRRETCDEIGPLDEQFGVGMFEDDDYAQRMKAKGYRVMCVADVFVHHFGQAAFKKLIENGSYNPLFDENRSYYETKWNVTWTPHKHARLKFEQVTHAPLDTQAAGEKG